MSQTELGMSAAGFFSVISMLLQCWSPPSQSETETRQSKKAYESSTRQRSLPQRKCVNIFGKPVENPPTYEQMGKKSQVTGSQERLCGERCPFETQKKC